MEGTDFVRSVINDYKLSDEFKEDALRLIYKQIFNKYNSIIANLGIDFWQEKMTQVEFAAEMDKYLDERQTFRNTFQTVFGYSPEFDDIK